MSVAWVILAGVLLALLAVAVMVLIRHHTHDADHAHDPAARHLETLRAQRPHVERLANRLEHEQSNNHFRVRVEKAIRGQW